MTVNLPGAKLGLLWPSLLGSQLRPLPGPDPGLLLAEPGLGESVKEVEKSTRVDFALDRTGPGLEESELAFGSEPGLAPVPVVLRWLSLVPDRLVLEDDGEMDAAGSTLEPEATREALEMDGVGLGLSEVELNFNSDPGLQLEPVLRFLGSRSSFDPKTDLEPISVLESRLSLEPVLDLELGQALELSPVLESKLSFDPQLILDAVPLLESRLSLDPIPNVFKLALALESEPVLASRLSLDAVVPLEFELDLDPETVLKSLHSKFSLDPDVLPVLAFVCTDSLGLRELGWVVLVLSSADSDL